MRSHRPSFRAFTLIELLIVIAIIAVLSTVLMTALSGAKKRTQIAVAKSQITALKAALANYKSDMGRFPRRSQRPTSATDATAYNDDCVALYAALRNKPTLGAGGGQNSPYVDDWKAEYVGWVTDTGGMNATTNFYSDGTQYVERVPPDEAEDLMTLNYQNQHLPSNAGGGNGPLVFLDPWGNPYHYREWASVRSNYKDLMITTPVSRNGLATPPTVEGNVITDNIRDRPHNPEGFDIWSNGPNGVNEYGHPESDDVTSWSE